jgi:hypothetical protein
MPAIDTPDTATRKVTIATIRCAGSSRAAVTAAMRAPSSASPATAVMRMGGLAATSTVAAPDSSPSTASEPPAATAATQRFSRSGWASGPAAIAAVIAARFIAIPPNGAAIIFPAPVLRKIARAGACSKPKVRSTANPGTFWPAIVTR